MMKIPPSTVSSIRSAEDFAAFLKTTVPVQKELTRYTDKEFALGLARYHLVEMCFAPEECHQALNDWSCDAYYADVVRYLLGREIGQDNYKIVIKIIEGLFELIKYMPQLDRDVTVIRVGKWDFPKTNEFDTQHFVSTTLDKKFSETFQMRMEHPYTVIIKKGSRIIPILGQSLRRQTANLQQALWFGNMRDDEKEIAMEFLLRYTTIIGSEYELLLLPGRFKKIGQYTYEYTSHF